MSSGEVGAVGRAQEAEAVLQDLEHAVGEDVLAALGVGLEDREDDVLLARPREPLEAQRLGQRHQLPNGLHLELVEVHEVLAEVGLADHLVLGEGDDLLVLATAAAAAAAPPLGALVAVVATVVVVAAVVAVAVTVAVTVAVAVAVAVAAARVLGQLVALHVVGATAALAAALGPVAGRISEVAPHVVTPGVWRRAACRAAPWRACRRAVPARRRP
jgi:hypothetical protein